MESGLRRKSYDLDFDDYLDFIKSNIPRSLFINDSCNKDLFLSINTAFKLSDLLTDFEFVTPKDNYYNLLVEYKKYFARILSAICLNDKFLIDNILRLLTEKLYRILTGLFYPARGERRIRKDSRNDMSSDLTGKVNPTRKSELDLLYVELSQAIHHSNATPVDLYDIRRLFITDSSITQDTIVITNQLTDIFIDEVFLKICLGKIENCSTSFLINIDNNLVPDVVQKIHTQLGI